MGQHLCSLLTDLFLVFSSRPVVDLTVSMTFTPTLLPMAFQGEMDVELCFEVGSSSEASKQGNNSCLGCPGGVAVFPDWLVGAVLVPLLEPGSCVLTLVK